MINLLERYRGHSIMKKIYVIEDLCNGCRLCETFCSSLKNGVFSEKGGRISVIKMPGEEKDVPIINCDGTCIRPLFGENTPTCVSLCSTGALYYADQSKAVETRLFYESAKKEHGIFKVIAPWKWPFPWRRPGAKKATSASEDIL